MAYVPGSHYDVFISYARRSDMADWVSRFRTELETQLCSRLGGRESSVWMDSKLIVGDDFAEKIQSKLRNTALLLAVISPRLRRKRSLQGSSALEALTSSWRR